VALPLRSGVCALTAAGNGCDLAAAAE
jgi:hypothetical protein